MDVEALKKLIVDRSGEQTTIALLAVLDYLDSDEVRGRDITGELVAGNAIFVIEESVTEL